jgi:hypothetical protein
MLYYVPNMRRFNQGTVEYCALVSLQMVQAARGGHFDTLAPVPAAVAGHGLPSASVRAMFANNGFIPVAAGVPVGQFTASAIHLGLQRFGPMIACGQIGAGQAPYGHAVVVFGVDTTNNLVLLKDPNRTMPQFGTSDSFADATVVTLALFNLVLARGALGDRCFVGKPGGETRLATEAHPTYVMGNVIGMVHPDVGRVFEVGGRRREV